MVVRQTSIDGKQIANCIAQFRSRRPQVHCITNSVAQHFTANVLLAAGATPSMTINADEVADFVEMADALLVNLGTMDDQRSKAIEIAVDVVARLQKPWALDPVFAQASPLRLEQAKSLMNRKPDLTRCNAAEMKFLFDIKPETPQLRELAARSGSIIALTGALDVVCSSKFIVQIENGSMLMDRITTMGCSLTAMMAGFMALEEDPLLSAVSATSLFGLAGEVAEKNSGGPGTFVPAFLDALHTLHADEISARVRLS